jgi:hypothetical protein
MSSQSWGGSPMVLHPVSPTTATAMGNRKKLRGSFHEINR